MAVYKLVSVKKVLTKVFTDLDLQEGTHRITDMIEWVGEALEKIGAFPQFINKVTGKNDYPLLTLANYQTALPQDFHRLIQVAYAPTTAGPFYPMRTATGSFEGVRPNLVTSSTDPEVIASDSAIITVTMDLYDLTYEEAIAKINSEPATRSLINSMLTSSVGTATPGNEDTSLTDDLIYVITDSYLKANIKDGYIMMAYQAIPTDADGYPMIPDLISFHEALYWYINMKLMYPQWKMGTIRDGVYFDARRSWNYYCKQAYGEALMPNADQMESIKNTWLRLVPDLNQHNTFFSTLGQAETIYNHHNV